MLIALLLLVIPGALVARAGRLTWPAAVAVGPPLTYGVVSATVVAMIPLAFIMTRPFMPWGG